MRIGTGRSWAAAVLVGAVLAGVGWKAVPALGIGDGAPEPGYGFVARVDVGLEKKGCSGTLVDPEWILFVSQCLTGAIPVPGGGPGVPIWVSVGATVDRPVVEVQGYPDRNLWLARLEKPVTDVTPVRIGTTAPTVGESVIAAGVGRTATEWAPERPHAGAFTVRAVAETSVDVEPEASASVCKGDAGGPVLRQTGDTVELVAVNSHSWQGGCLGVADSETRRGARQTRVDNVKAWVQQTVGATFVRLASSAQVLDTRRGIGTTVGTRSAGSTTTFTVEGVGGIPVNTRAVMLDITGVAPGGTYISVFPDATPQNPTVGMLNVRPGEAISNSAVVPLGRNGRLSVYTQGAADIVIDVQGYYTRGSGGGFVPVDHTRLVDTRAGAGAAIPSRGSQTFTLTGRAGIPTGASVALVDAVVVGASAAGWLGVHPTGGSNDRSAMDFVAGETSHAIAVRLGTDGRATFTNNSDAPIHLVLTAEGYHTATATTGWGMRTLAATRLLDTRANSGSPLPSGGTRDVAVGLPAGSVALLNLTVVGNTHTGFLRAWPVGGTEPSTSLTNFPSPGGVRSGLAAVKVGTDGKVRISVGGNGTAHVLVESQGWFAPPLP